MDFKSLIPLLQKGAEFVEQAAPLAGAFGPEGALIGKIAGGVASFADTALTKAEEADAVIEATDLATVRELQTRIQAANDQLAAEIDAS